MFRNVLLCMMFLVMCLTFSPNDSDGRSYYAERRLVNEFTSVAGGCARRYVNVMANNANNINKTEANLYKYSTKKNIDYHDDLRRKQNGLRY